uniref:Uncharacterized protein n=1 Tax=Arundo donax TaxID=35708 RepID=A0A0A8Z4J8_ARUDO
MLGFSYLSFARQIAICCLHDNGSDARELGLGFQGSPRPPDLRPQLLAAGWTVGGWRKLWGSKGSAADFLEGEIRAEDGAD